MYAAIGVHPKDTGELSEDGWDWLGEAAAGEKVGGNQRESAWIITGRSRSNEVPEEVVFPAAGSGGELKLPVRDSQPGRR